MTNNQNRIQRRGRFRQRVRRRRRGPPLRRFLDGDFLYPRSNILKMAAGEALNDDDRAPWLAALNDAAFAMQRTNNVSITVCSALKKQYRDRLRAGNATCRISPARRVPRPTGGA